MQFYFSYLPSLYFLHCRSGEIVCEATKDAMGDVPRRIQAIPYLAARYQEYPSELHDPEQVEN